MRIAAALVAATGAFALSACQTTQTGEHYVKQGPGPVVETAIAECRAIAAKASHIVIGIGGPEVIVAGLIGTAVATGVRRTQVFEQCMTAQGYRKADAKAAEPAPAPAPPPQPRKAPKAITAPARAG